MKISATQYTNLKIWAMKKSVKKLPGFSLTELLVVLVIIGILVLLALPNFNSVISKAKSTEAQIQLGHLYSLEKSHFYMYSKYSDDLDEIGFEQQNLVSDGGTANYKIEIVTATNTEFVATATTITDFDGDGNYNAWEINQDKQLKEIQKD